MRVIAHRGLWYNPSEKNSLYALKNAIDNGFGIETDIRDYCGEIVISHDIPDDKCEKLYKLFEYYNSVNSSVILALNIKSDGIQKKLKDLIKKYSIKNYFLFDMSIPEFVININEDLKCYTRNSDIESECVLYEKVTGVWLDSFYDMNWINYNNITSHLSNNKKVCVVSPELHNKDYSNTWKMLKENILNENILICTDFPKQAKEYFNE